MPPLPTSNTYEFGTNTQIDDLIRESFERIGIIGNEFTGLQITSAIMSANLELSQWTGRVPLSWMRKRMLLSVYPNQPIYQLPVNITQIVDVVLTQMVRLNTGGTAYSSEGGDAANAFNPAAANIGCVQTASDGYISYDYGEGNSNSILYVGIQGLQPEATYTIDVQYSFDNLNWNTIYEQPTQIYYANQPVWFVIENSLNARAWRIVEQGGATLEIAQIYFNQPTNAGSGDRWLTALSYTEWMQIATKMQTSFPSSYFFNAQIQPTITLWPVLQPGGQFNGLLYTAYQYLQDVVLLTQQFDVPQRFFEALVAGISKRLAVKFKPEAVPLMKVMADEAFAMAANTDYENVTLRVQPDFSDYASRR